MSFDFHRYFVPFYLVDFLYISETYVFIIIWDKNDKAKHESGLVRLINESFDLAVASSEKEAFESSCLKVIKYMF